MGNLSRQRGRVIVRQASAGVIANALTGASAFLVENTLDGWVSVELTGTLGSLTNFTCTPQVSMDGTNWFTLSDPGALGPLTASGAFAFACNCKGWTWFRAAMSSTGTTTGSSAVVNYHFSTAGGVAS